MCFLSNLQPRLLAGLVISGDFLQGPAPLGVGALLPPRGRVAKSGLGVLAPPGAAAPPARHRITLAGSFLPYVSAFEVIKGKLI